MTDSVEEIKECLENQESQVAIHAIDDVDVDKIIADALLDCFEEDAERSQEDLDVLYLWTVGNAEATPGAPLHNVNSNEDLEKLENGDSFVATIRTMMRFNEEHNKKLSADFD